jgi:hypothetical protein
MDLIEFPGGCLSGPPLMRAGDSPGRDENFRLDRLQKGFQIQRLSR